MFWKPKHETEYSTDFGLTTNNFGLATDFGLTTSNL